MSPLSEVLTWYCNTASETWAYPPPAGGMWLDDERGPWAFELYAAEDDSLTEGSPLEPADPDRFTGVFPTS